MLDVGRRQLVSFSMLMEWMRRILPGHGPDSTQDKVPTYLCEEGK